MQRYIENWLNMVFRNFRLQIVLRVGVLFFLLFSLAFMLANADWHVTPVVFLALALLSVIDLIRYVEFTNRSFDEFLNSIYYQDFSTNVPVRNIGKSFRRLSMAYKLITDSFRRITYQKEEHLSLLESIVDHLQVAVMCVGDNGHIKLMNQASKALFKTPHIHHLDGLRRIDSFVYNCVQKLLPGEQQLISATIKGNAVSLSVINNEFRVGDNKYRLLSFHNIRDELEQQESAAWQKLIRVLAHEIMNSATPILSLSSSIKSMIEPEEGNSLSIQQLSSEEQRDLVRGLDSIENRSKGLIEFVDAYRDLTQIPEPKPSPTELSTSIQNVVQLLMPEIGQENIKLETKYDSGNPTVTIDAQQIEQVLINLIRNAIQALNNCSSPRIVIHLFRNEDGKNIVDIEDNGVGISEDNLANIFMPFYTTKKDGTGVGLSISRQIMFMNRGLLTAESTEGVGSRFRLEFPG